MPYWQEMTLKLYIIFLLGRYIVISTLSSFIWGSTQYFTQNNKYLVNFLYVVGSKSSRSFILFFYLGIQFKAHYSPHENNVILTIKPTDC